MNSIIIAIDGHSSTGKSTVAKALAEKLSYTYIDTGAMYRCVAHWAIKKGFISDESVNEDLLIDSLPNINICFSIDEVTKQQLTFLNGENVEGFIRGLKVSQSVSIIARIEAVRVFLVSQQQEMGEDKAIVMDGRDIGTVVFPYAELKIFMTADAEIRAKRRYEELLSKGEEVQYSDVLTNVVERDHMDETRAIGPLKQANDAILLNNSNMTKEEQLEFILSKVECHRM